MALISRPISFSLLIILITIIPKSASPAPTFLANNCSNTTMFRRNSTYQSNLNTLFQSLSSNATNPAGFHRASAGNTTSSNAVYGLFLCRGDQNTTACQDCVATATATDLPDTYCPRRKVAVIWYDECMVRYSNESFFGKMDDYPGELFWNAQNVTGNLTGFKEVVEKMMDDVAVGAAKGGSQKKYATNVAGFNSLQTLYGMGQCTPDLSGSDCDECLQIAIGALPISLGGRVLLPSCSVRYEIYPFFNGAANLTVSPPPAPPPITSTNSSTGAVPVASPPNRKKKLSTKVIIAIVVPIAAVSVALLAIGICFVNKKAKKYGDVAEDDTGEDFTEVESLQYDLETLQTATNYFSHQNKIGEGGFGGVYKGKLANGKEIAVKRLSKSSGQGAQEFKNEVLLVAKLQHRNLVRVLGFCLAGEEKLLVYEYVQNKSLDYFLFDPVKREQLDWGRRYNIITGIARGMLYLHQDSRLRIIHRDLKTGNILLDADMNPKIADFGMAKIFGGDQTEGNTSRVVGTYGYMSPEYAMHGQFSDKSDAYSFGVLILEIISGKRNSAFYQTGSSEDLLSYAWKQWRNGTPLEFADPSIRDSCSAHEVMRCIHLGLLCVQESVDDRPTMATVVLTLDSSSVTLSMPKQPVFFISSKAESTITEATHSSNRTSRKSVTWSVNDASITEVEPR